MKIGVFDSGLGGLTVANGIYEKLRGHEIFYLADNERAPYGDKEDNEIRSCTYEMIDYLLTKKIDVLVIACNTITSFMLDEIKGKLNIPVIGVIEPAINEALEKTDNNQILLLATNKTVNTNIYEKLIKEKNNKVNLLSKSCPKFVPMIEKNEINLEIISEELELVKGFNFDTIILGCTHYPYIKEEIETVLKRKVKFADSVENIVKEIKKLNDYYEINLNNDISFYTTGNFELFNKKIIELFNMKSHVELIKIKANI